MRIRFAMMFASAALAASFAGPQIAAAGEPDTKEETATVKAAGAAVRTIVGGASKLIRASASAATVRIAALDRAVKTGKDVADLSGVASTPGVKVSAEQRAGLLDACVESVALFDDECLAHCSDAYAAFAESSACRSLGETDSLQRLGGSGGPVDQFTAGLAAGWDKGQATVERALARFQVTLTKAGTSFTRIGGPAPAFTTPTFVSPPGRVIDVPVVLGTFGDSDGALRALVAYSGETPIGDFRESNTAVVAASSAGTLGFSGIFFAPGGEEGERSVHIYTEDINSSFSGGGRVFMIDKVTSVIRPATPVNIVDPGPCVPAGGDGDVTSSTELLDLGTAMTGQSASSSFVLTNNTAAPLDVTLSIVATGNNVNKFIFFNSSMRTIQNGSTIGVGIGASSSTPGTFTAKLRVTWANGTLDVPLKVTITN